MCSMGALEVPGCSGTPAAGWSYCHMPSKELKNKKNYHGKGGKSKHKAYGMCKGHCEADSDCTNSLICFDTNGHAGMTVPGCSGRARQHVNYCIQAVSIWTCSPVLCTYLLYQIISLLSYCKHPHLFFTLLISQRI